MLWFLFCFCGSSDGFQRLRNRKYFIFRFDDHHHNKIVAISVIGCVIRMNGVPPRAAKTNLGGPHVGSTWGSFDSSSDLVPQPFSQDFSLFRPSFSFLLSSFRLLLSCPSRIPIPCPSQQ